MTLILTTLLSNTVRILDLLKIKYTIAHGTLIGWARNGKFLSHDDDIDLRIYPPHWLRLTHLLKYATYRMEVHKVEVGGEIVDVGPIRPDGRLNLLTAHRDFQVRVAGSTPQSYDVHVDVVSGECVKWKIGKGCFWQSYVGPAISAFDGEMINSTLNGVPVSVTPHWDEVLSAQYGKHWRTPNVRL